MIQGEAVVLARAPENKEQQSETRDDVTDEAAGRIVQQMAEGDDDQDEAKRDESVAGTQAEDNERSGDEFDERNGDADRPQRSDRQGSVGVR
jgi:hypothetical protein